MFLNATTWDYHAYQSFAVSSFDFYIMIDAILPMLEGTILKSSREILMAGEKKCLVYEMRPSMIDLLSNTGFHSAKADFDRRIFGGRCP
jgi:hypothetical protein